MPSSYTILRCLQYFMIIGFCKYNALRVAAGFAAHNPHNLVVQAQSFIQIYGISFPIGNRLLRYAAFHSRPGYCRRYGCQQAGIKRLGYNIVGSKRHIGWL